MTGWRGLGGLEEQNVPIWTEKYRKSWPERNICASVSDFTILLFFHASQLMQARRSANESRSEHYQTLIKMNAKAPWRTV